MKSKIDLDKTIRRHAEKPTTCVVVSKGHPIAAITQAHTLGHRHFGENYLQEALPKIIALKENPITWHFIGTIQSNKTTLLAQHFDWVQTITSEKIARRLSSAREALPPLNVCIQITLTKGENGLPLHEVPALMQTIQALPNLKLRGLFYKPPPMHHAADLKKAFSTVTAFFKAHQATHNLDTLSMGMSGDFTLTLASGANMLRLGTYVLGPRP